MDAHELERVMHAAQKRLDIEYWLVKFGEYAAGVIEENVQAGTLKPLDDIPPSMQPGDSFQSTPQGLYMVAGEVPKECQAAMDTLWRIKLIRESIEQAGVDRTLVQSAALHGLFLGLIWLDLQ